MIIGCNWALESGNYYALSTIMWQLLSSVYVNQLRGRAGHTAVGASQVTGTEQSMVTRTSQPLRHLKSGRV